MTFNTILIQYFMLSYIRGHILDLEGLVVSLNLGLIPLFY